VTAVLLDTCAIIYLAERQPMASSAVELVVAAGLAAGIFISPVSAWEIGLLARPGRRSLDFAPDPGTWLNDFLAKPGVKATALSFRVAVAASALPEPLHCDRADRLLIATARDLSIPIVTRDRKIIDYAAAGHVEVVPC
jgi:PIN domain nuclease of toxin-antitoxin system